MPQKSKIVKMSRFKIFGPPDFPLSSTYESDMFVLHKKEKRGLGVKPHMWFNKKEKGADHLTKEERYIHGIKRRCEVFAAWQYEAFISHNNTQPKYYLIRQSGAADSIATKRVNGYRSLNDILKENKTNGAEALQQSLFAPKNIKPFAQMIINYLWLAASDFKLDHLGVDEQGNLICIDFEESLLPFRLYDNAFPPEWNFTITSNDLLDAPFFTTYHTHNFFIDLASNRFPDVFNFLKNNTALQHQLCCAILKKCIFPKYIEFASLELFTDRPECIQPLKEFMHARTSALRSAALQNPIFVEFMHNQGQAAYEEIKAEILHESFQNKRYFRNNKKKFSKHCSQELNTNFSELVKLIPALPTITTTTTTAPISEKIKHFVIEPNVSTQQTNPILFFALQHPIITIGLIGLAVALTAIVTLAFIFGETTKISLVKGLFTEGLTFFSSKLDKINKVAEDPYVASSAHFL